MEMEHETNGMEYLQQFLCECIWMIVSLRHPLWDLHSACSRYSCASNSLGIEIAPLGDWPTHDLDRLT